MLGLKHVQSAIEKSPNTIGQVSVLVIVASALVCLALSLSLMTLLAVTVVLSLGWAVASLFFGKWTRKEAEERLKRQFRRVYKEQPCHVQNIQVDATGFRNSCPCGKHEFYWNTVVASWETKISIAVRFSNRLMLIFPKAVLGANAEPLRNLLRSRIQHK